MGAMSPCSIEAGLHETKAHECVNLFASTDYEQRNMPLWTALHIRTSCMTFSFNRAYRVLTSFPRFLMKREPVHDYTNNALF